MNHRFLRVAASQLQLVQVKAAVAVVLVVSKGKLEAAFAKAAAKPQRQLLCKGRQTGSSRLASKLAAAFAKAAAKPQRQLLCKGRQTGSSRLASKLAAALHAREIASYLSLIHI